MTFRIGTERMAVEFLRAFDILKEASFIFNNEPYLVISERYESTIKPEEMVGPVKV